MGLNQYSEYFIDLKFTQCKMFVKTKKKVSKDSIWYNKNSTVLNF